MVRNYGYGLEEKLRGYKEVFRNLEQMVEASHYRVLVSSLVLMESST